MSLFDLMVVDFTKIEERSDYSSVPPEIAAVWRSRMEQFCIGLAKQRSTPESLQILAACDRYQKSQISKSQLLEYTWDIQHMTARRNRGDYYANCPEVMVTEHAAFCLAADNSRESVKNAIACYYHFFHTSWYEGDIIVQARELFHTWLHETVAEF